MTNNRKISIHNVPRHQQQQKKEKNISNHSFDTDTELKIVVTYVGKLIAFLSHPENKYFVIQVVQLAECFTLWSKHDSVVIKTNVKSCNFCEILF